MKAEDVLHVVEAGWFTVGPFSGAEGAASKGVAAGGLVGQFDTFTDGGVDDGVISDDVSSADGMHSDFVLGPFTDDAEAAVADIVIILKIADFC